MADMITYADFWYLTFLPLILQTYVLMYVVQWRHLLGSYMTNIRVGQSLILLTVYSLFMVILIAAGGEAGIQPMEAWGFFVAFVFPNGLSALCFLETRHLKKGFTTNYNINLKRDAIRDANRDIKRDTMRDVDRDIERDRELYEKGDDRNKKE